MVTVKYRPSDWDVPEEVQGALVGFQRMDDESWRRGDRWLCQELDIPCVTRPLRYHRNTNARITRSPCLHCRDKKLGKSCSLVPHDSEFWVIRDRHLVFVPNASAMPQRSASPPPFSPPSPPLWVSLPDLGKRRRSLSPASERHRARPSFRLETPPSAVFPDALHPHTPLPLSPTRDSVTSATLASGPSDSSPHRSTRAPTEEPPLPALIGSELELFERYIEAGMKWIGKKMPDAQRSSGLTASQIHKSLGRFETGLLLLVQGQRICNLWAQDVGALRFILSEGMYQCAAGREAVPEPYTREIVDERMSRDMDYARNMLGELPILSNYDPDAFA